MPEQFTFENYLEWRKEFQAAKDNPPAFCALVQSFRPNETHWLRYGYLEFRQLLSRGDLAGAEELGHMIGMVLEVVEQDVLDELSETCIHYESLRSLLDGVYSIQMKDNLTGLKQLEQLTEAIYCHESIRWLAWFWSAKAASDEGDLTLAKAAVNAALSLAKQIDFTAIAETLCLAGEIESLPGNFETASQFLQQAIQSYEQLNDPVGLARAQLILARIFIRMQQKEGAQIARKLSQAYPEWDEPYILLSQWALIQGQLDQAENVLHPLMGQEQPSAEFRRQMRLVQFIREQQISLATANEYLWFKSRMPDADELDLLRELHAQYPHFIYLQELLIWHLLKLGHGEEAARHLDELADIELDPEVQDSIWLGLRCLANRKLIKKAEIAHPFATLLESAAFDSNQLPDEFANSPKTEPNKTISGPITVGGNKAVFTGDLQLFAVPDLLDFLKTSQRTGILVITSEQGEGMVRLRRGMIIGADSPKTVKIGDLLVQKGAISKKQLAAATAFQEQGHPHQFLGDILVEWGWVDKKTLEDVMLAQVRSALVEMSTWNSGEFAFESDKRTANRKNEEEIQSAKFHIELNTQAVLLDVLQQIDEQNSQNEDDYQEPDLCETDSGEIDISDSTF